MNICVLLAGGSGSRIGADKPKQFIEVFSKPIISYTLDILNADINISKILIVCIKDWIDILKNIVKKYNYNKVFKIVEGGNTFLQSSIKGLEGLNNIANKNDNIIFNFAVSALTTKEILEDSILVCNQSNSNGISTQKIPLCTCLSENSKFSDKFIDRYYIRGFDNPWTFKYGELLETIEMAKKNNMLNIRDQHLTSLYLLMGKRIYFSKSSSLNFKITTKEDLDLFTSYIAYKNTLQ